jgi:large subunit ribosomal protein L25
VTPRIRAPFVGCAATAAFRASSTAWATIRRPSRLAGSGAVIELQSGSATTAAVLKDAQRHPVRGEVMHVDLLRVDLNKPIQTLVVLHLVGGEDSPGVRDGGVLEHAREVTVEALPNDIPEALEYDVSAMNVNDSATVADLSAPAGVTIIDDPETVVVTLNPPRLEVETDEVETETALVGEGAAEADASGDGASDEDAAADAADGSESGDE